MGPGSDPTSGHESVVASPGSTSGRDLRARLDKIWEDVLGVGPDVGFFETGGQSILALLLTVRIREELGVEVGLSSILENPTVQALTTVLQRAPVRGSAPPGTPVSGERDPRRAATT